MYTFLIAPPDEWTSTQWIIAFVVLIVVICLWAWVEAKTPPPTEEELRKKISDRLDRDRWDNWNETFRNKK